MVHTTNLSSRVCGYALAYCSRGHDEQNNMLINQAQEKNDTIQTPSKHKMHDTAAAYHNIVFNRKLYK